MRTHKYFEHLGVPVVAGSEDNIPSYSAWVAGTEDNPRHSWVDYDFEDDASSSRPHDPWTRGDDVPGGPSRDNEIEEEESEDGDDDEASDDEPADASSSEE